MENTSRTKLANAIRALSIDAIQKANSGHPGMPMGMADIAEVLWNDFLAHNPNNPNWFNRDRFVISNGHGSMLLYSLLHFSGYDLSLEDIKQFRQLHSKTPGHPEYGLTSGVETTTGPLGQGLANAVGMAIAEKALAAHYNKPDFPIIDHYTYVFAGDGCLMEGISHEVCSLAGTLGLSKLIVIYDDNGISIDGRVQGWFTDDTPKRFDAYRWHVIPRIDGHDPEAIAAALQEARTQTERPSLLCCQTIIGYGSPNMANTSKVHGSPLGDAEIAATRAQLGWSDPPFVIPQDIYQKFDARAAGTQREDQWRQIFEAYRKAYPDLAAELERRITRELPSEWHTDGPELCRKLQVETPKALATRQSSQAALNTYCPLLPEMIGGSADLTGSNNTNWKGSKPISKDDFDGNYIYFGVREFGMTAIANGIALHGGWIPYVGTFLVFSDYARNAVRLAAMMHIHAIFVYTHDSIGLGEDGPTHQPVEQLEGLRNIPGLTVWRPCDTTETAVAWKSAIEYKHGPVCLILSRQALPPQKYSPETLANIARGGYILFDCADTPEAILIATGSEVQIAIQAAQQMQSEGRHIRVVSMPCREIFDAQDQTYRDSVLPPHISSRIAIECGVSHGWQSYVSKPGKVIGLNQFGESAPADVAFATLGFSAENVINHLKEIL
jgi:transketolase